MSTILNIRDPKSSNLPVMQSNLIQSSDETRVYSLDLSDFTSPTTPVVTAKNMSTEQVATSSVVTVGGAIVGTDLTFTISNLQAINRYKIDMKFTSTTEIIEPYLILDCNS